MSKKIVKLIRRLKFKKSSISYSRQHFSIEMMITSLKSLKLNFAKKKVTNGLTENVTLGEKTDIIMVLMENFFTERFGSTSTAKFRKVMLFII